MTTASSSAVPLSASTDLRPASLREVSLMKPAKSPLAPRIERYREGQAQRHQAPRRANADWSASDKRTDPVDILIRQGESRIRELLPVRYARMRASPLAFLRGAAAVMASDLATTSHAGINVQSCGDCHLNNFGSYATPEGMPVFDINDFDETSTAPFEWDLKRLATSLVLAGREGGLSSRECRMLAIDMTQAYVAEIIRLAEMTPFQAWNARIDLMRVIDEMPGHRTRDKLRQRLMRQIASMANQFGMIEPGTMPKLREHPPLVQRIPNQDESVRHAFARYVAQLPPERRILMERYALTDIIFKVVGIGSVGTFCALGLFSTADGETILLQIKEAQSSVLENNTGISTFANHGERVVVGQRIMQAASDAFLGWTHSVGQRNDAAGAGRHFYVRQTKDSRLAAIGERIEDELLPFYAQLCGHALGRAHGRSADLPLLAGYLGRGRGFADAIAQFGVRYASQTEKDWQVFNRAIADGRIEAG